MAFFFFNIKKILKRKEAEKFKEYYNIYKNAPSIYKQIFNPNEYKENTPWQH